MVVRDPVLVAGGEPAGWMRRMMPLSTRTPRGVVHRLARDRADLGFHRFGDVIRGAVRVVGHGSQNGDALCGDLDMVLAKECDRVQRHV